MCGYGRLWKICAIGLKTGHLFVYISATACKECFHYYDLTVDDRIYHAIVTKPYPIVFAVFSLDLFYIDLFRVFTDEQFTDSLFVLFSNVFMSDDDLTIVSKKQFTV